MPTPKQSLREVLENIRRLASPAEHPDTPIDPQQALEMILQEVLEAEDFLAAL